MRQIVLDTETTGFSPKNGDRIIELAMIELVDRKETGQVYHCRFNPEREISEGATKVHGMTWEMLKTEPFFRDQAGHIREYIADSEIIIHNAEFDMAFLRWELSFHAANIMSEPTPQKKTPESILYIRDFYHLPNPAFCTLKFCRERDGVGKFAKGYKLEQQCFLHGIHDTRTKHSAIEDARMLAQLYLKLTEKFYL